MSAFSGTFLICGLAACSLWEAQSREGKSGAAQVELTFQRRDPAGKAAREPIALDPARTAIVVIDMWDRHWCTTYTARVGNLVPRMNQTLAAARKLGIQIVHAPSDVVGFYQDYPQRKAMQAIPDHPVPRQIDFNPPDPPGGKDCCECGPDRPCRNRGAWTRQHPDLTIADGDLIGDCNNHRELLNLCGQRGINTLIYMGVASNMCVLGRAFGILNMKRHGLDAMFVRDLVEAITANGYDPELKKKDPNFTPAKGSALVQRYLEQYVAPSVDSRQVIAAAGMDPHTGDRRLHLVFVIAEDEYQTDTTLPAFAKQHLQDRFRCTFLVNHPKDPNDVPGLDALYDADLLILSMRRRALPVIQMDHLERYIREGRPLVAIRVSCVPFQVKTCPVGHVAWADFDREVLGCHYQGYDSQSRQTGCNVWALPEAADHFILTDLREARFRSQSWLYQMRSLAPTVKPLLMGRWSDDHPVEPVAWTGSYEGGRVFYTSLGHLDDFKTPQFNRVLVNAIHWALDQPITTR